MNAPRLLLRASCHAGSVMRLFLLMGIMLGWAAELASANESPAACITSVTPPSPRAGQSVTVSGSCSDDDDGFLTRYEWTFSDGLFSKTSNQASVTRMVDAPGAYTVMLRVKDNDGAWSIRKKRKFTVTAATFTVNVLPSAGCAVTAGDGGVDAVEAPNGIVCSGGMAADDPLCMEQFKQSAVAALKVVPAAGYAFTGWTVNGAQVKTAAEPLLLTTMPRLAGLADLLLANTTVANVAIGCPEIAFQIVKPGTTDEIVEYEAINVNYDDDDDTDGGGLAHGETVVQSDKDDPNGVTGGDNDLVELRVNITDPNATIASYRVDYDQTFLHAWTSREKTPDAFVASNATTLPVSQTSIYVEGVTPHGSTAGSPITLRAVNAAGEEVAQRTVTVVVANPIFAIFGGGPVDAAKNAINDHLKDHAIDQRMNASLPGILLGSTINQIPVYYSVAVCSQTPQCAQLAKIALQTDGADVVFNGHANSGIGLSFVPSGQILTNVASFFNMTGKRHGDQNPAIAGIPWVLELTENGPVTIAPSEIPETVENYIALPGIVDQLKFPNDPLVPDGPENPVGAGDWFTLTKQGNTPMPDLWYHYEYTFATPQKHLLVTSGSADVPLLHYRSLFLYLCSSGRHFLETFQHGQAFYTTDETSPEEEPKEFIKRIVAGMEWSQIQTELHDLYDETIAYHSF